MKPQPAIRREYSRHDREIETDVTVYDNVSFQRGFGNTGYRLELVEHDCPVCSHDRLLRRHRVNSESRDTAEYWCLNPVCAHYLADRFSYARTRQANKPALYDVDAVCPDCDEAQTVPSDVAESLPTNDDDVTLALCSTCQANRAEHKLGV